MPKSQFQQVLHVVGNQLHASGPFTLEEDGDLAAVRVQWLVAQGHTVARGDVRPDFSHWEDVDVQQIPWEAGPAQAVGLITTLTPQGAGTFAWAQSVTIEID